MILDRFGVTDKVAVVTGAGRGIGAATDVDLAEAGAEVVISSRTETDLKEIAERVARAGRRAHVVLPTSPTPTRLPVWRAQRARSSAGWTA